MTASRGGATRRRPAVALKGRKAIRLSASSRRLAAVLAATLAAAGCGGGSGDTPSSYTEDSIKRGFVKPADIGEGAVEFEDTGESAHIVYTPEDSVPTCPYVQRSDDAPADLIPAVQLQGANSTGRFIVGPPTAGADAPPVVTQGALVFQTPQLAEAGMKEVNAAAAKCPGSFTILGGPPQIIGSYTVNSRPIELHGWKGFAQQLAHTSPPQVNPETFDDLVTIVLHKDNAILYAGFTQIKNIGERADSGEKAEQIMTRTLERLG